MKTYRIRVELTVDAATIADALNAVEQRALADVKTFSDDYLPKLSIDKATAEPAKKTRR